MREAMANKLDINVLGRYTAGCPPKKRRELQSLSRKMTALHSMDEVKAFFVRNNVTIRYQYPLMVILLDTISSTDFYAAALDYIATLDSLMERTSAEHARLLRSLSDRNKTSGVSSGGTGPLETFRLTDAGRAASRPAWDAFLQAVSKRFIAPDALGAFRSLLGLDDEPLDGPLTFHGSKQQLMLLFSSLCGTLVYTVPPRVEGVAAGRYRSVPFIAMKESRGFKGSQTPDGAAASQPRIADPYCQLLAAALLDRNGEPLNPRSLTSAKNLLGNPAKGTPVDNVRPLLAALVALGALRLA